MSQSVTARLLVTVSERGITELFADYTGDVLFAYANADLEACTDLAVRDIHSRINLKNMKCVTPDEDLLPELCDTISAVHPLFEYADLDAILPDMLGTTLTLFLKDREVSKMDFLNFLMHLTASMTLFHTTIGKEDITHETEINRRNRLYYECTHIKEYGAEQSLRNRSILSFPSLQKYTRLYLYWVLDAGAARFKGLDADARQRLFARVFGSVNQWQPLSVKEVSCVGSPEAQTLRDILYGEIVEKINHMEDEERIMEVAKQKAAEEIERQSYARALTELISDDDELDAEVSGCRGE